MITFSPYQIGDGAVLEPIIVLSMAYLSYILADLFAFSGIVR